MAMVRSVKRSDGGRLDKERGSGSNWKRLTFHKAQTEPGKEEIHVEPVATTEMAA
jgi:hypothetical protein